MDHTTIVYVMGENGNLVASFSLKPKPEEAAAELRRYP
jgi:protein SCO1/2